MKKKIGKNRRESIIRLRVEGFHKFFDQQHGCYCCQRRRTAVRYQNDHCLPKSIIKGGGGKRRFFIICLFSLPFASLHYFIIIIIIILKTPLREKGKMKQKLTQRVTALFFFFLFSFFIFYFLCFICLRYLPLLCPRSSSFSPPSFKMLHFLHIVLGLGFSPTSFSFKRFRLYVFLFIVLLALESISVCRLQLFDIFTY